MTDSVLPAGERLVIVTRPRAQAGPLAQRIAAIGRCVMVFPLLEIQPLVDNAALDAAIADLAHYALVAFVSPNAINALFARLKAWPAGVPLAVMGEGSRQCLAQHGVTTATATIFSPRDPARTDSQTLLAALDLDALRGGQVLIVRGENGRELLSDALRAAGVRVTQVAAYRRSAPQLDADRQRQLQQFLSQRNDWIVTSSEALQILMRMVKQVDAANGVVKMQQQRIIVPHARIAETAQNLGLSEISLTGSGDERMLAALQCLA
jgi:uroporphyrinogen-III synthase